MQIRRTIVVRKLLPFRWVTKENLMYPAVHLGTAGYQCGN